MRSTLLILALPLLLSGCAAAVIGGATETGVSIAENRSIGRKIDDSVIYTDLTSTFIEEKQGELLGSVTFNVRYGRVMLTGTVKSQDDAEKAVALSWKAKGVQEVINELIVRKEKGFFDTASDALVKRNLEGRLLITKNVWVINYSIDVQGGAAFLIGRVHDRGELERVLNVARTTKGVKKVVSHLQVNADTQTGSSADTMSAPPAESARRGGLQNSVTNGPTMINTSPAMSTAPGGGVEAPGAVTSAPLEAPAMNKGR